MFQGDGDPDQPSNRATNNQQHWPFHGQCHFLTQSPWGEAACQSACESLKYSSHLISFVSVWSSKNCYPNKLLNLTWSFFLTLAINRLALNIWSFIAPFLVNRNPTVLATGRSHPWTRKASTEVLERRRRVGDLWPRKFRKNPSLLITLKLDAGDSRAWYDKPFKRRNSTKKKLILSRCAIRPPLAGLMVKYGEIATP